MFEASALSAEEIVRLCKQHSHLRVVRAGRVNPIPMAKAKGVFFWDANGKRYLDFNSQLMCVNIGHGDARVIQAIKDQADKLVLRQSVHGHRAPRPAGAAARGAGARGT